MPAHPVEIDDGSAGEELRFLAPGTMIAKRYEIDSPLGAGRNAAVYAAYDHELARRIAIKIFRTGRVSPAVLARTKLDFARASRVTSARVVRMLEIGKDGDRGFVTMELVEGTSLRRELSGGPLALDDALRVAQSIAEGLAALHAKGVVHRGLRPANVLVSKTGSVRLADFGTARPWELEGIPVGDDSPAYASPEQRRRAPLDPRSDLYSFGLVLWEMLAGRLPFDDAVSDDESARPRRVPDIRTARSDVPTWLATLVRRLLEDDPSERPEDAAAALATFCSKRIDWSYRWRKARRRAAVTLGAIALLAAAAAAGWHHHQTRFDAVERDDAGVLHALDRRGRTLWSADMRRAAVVRLDAKTTVVVGLPAGRSADDDWSRGLVARDAQTGAQAGAFSLPRPADQLSSHFVLESVDAVDVAGDSFDDVVAVYTRVGDPSTWAMLLDPRSNAAGPIFVASGRSRFLAALDLDGDERTEILFGGPNNRIADRFGVAAVVVRRDRLGMRGTWLASGAPDVARVDGVVDPLWYALLPGDASSIAVIDHVDTGSRAFDVRFGDGRRERLSFDGFPAAAFSPLPAHVRQQRREAAFRFLRDAADAEAQGYARTAVNNLISADQAARDARDRELVAWVETVNRELLERTRESEP